MDYTLTLEIPFILLGRVFPGDRESRGKVQDADVIQLVYDMLQARCQNIHIYSEEEAAMGWTLRITPETSMNGQLSLDEQKLVGHNTWDCSITIERRGIPLETDSRMWEEFEQEGRNICAVLNETFHELQTDLDTSSTSDKGKGKGKVCNLVCGQMCYLRVVLVPPEVRDLPTSLDLNVVRSIFTLVAGLEREMTLLSTPGSLLRFMPLSRFLECYCVEELQKEKKELWKRLRELKWGEERFWAVYARDEEKWIAGLDDIAIEYKRTKGRRQEWWDVIQSFEEETWESFVKSTQTCHGDLVLSCNTNASTAAKDDEGEYPSETYALNTIVAPNVSSLAFQGYRSTLNADQFLAYTELIAGISRTALRHTIHIHNWLEHFRSKVSSISPPSSPHSFQTLLDMLDVSQASKIFWHAHLTTLFSKEAPSAEKVTRPSMRADPFYPVRSHVEAALEKERAYMLMFVERYEDVGGFYATRGKKLYALMQAMSEDGGGEGKWLRELGVLSIKSNDRDGGLESQSKEGRKINERAEAKGKGRGDGKRDKNFSIREALGR